jgi:hypothetical protein
MKQTFRASLVLSIIAALSTPITANAVSTNPSASCVATTCTISFPFTGDYYTWTAPNSGTYILETWGAQGGNAAYNGTILTYGGKGGYAKGSISLTAGQILNIYIGGQGVGETSTSTSAYVAGGFNGGGNGFNGDLTTNNRGAGGGGGTDIRIGGTALANRVIVGGGGGGGVYFTGYGTNYPGFGGGLVGGDGGTANYNSTYSYSGKGGTQSAGGALGSNGTAGTAGASGQGGTGSDFYYGSGGGGGGYFGGGGSGGGMASGGGSGYVGGVSSTTLTAGNASMPNPAGGTMTGRSGAGFARITYTAASSTISLSVAGGATRVTKGQSIAITASINFAGKITFLADGKKIPGCISLQSSIGNRICNWKPAIQKSVLLTARLEPTGAIGSVSTPLNISVGRRTGAR